MNKVEEIADLLLGRRGMDKYPTLLVIGLLLISFSIRKHKERIPVFE
jgi:hypothetical protein